MPEEHLLLMENLIKHFPLGGGLLAKPHAWVRAVDGVSFSVRRGESFGLVGESGCGKSTLGRLIVRLLEPTAGRLWFEGQDYGALPRGAMRPLRRRMQIIFQDPYSSLDPRMKVGAIITEPLRATEAVSRAKQRRVAIEVLERVGLREDDLLKYPHEFSGGQRQRIGIARALCVRPDLIVADEPVSALDVSIQAQVINLLDDLRSELSLTYIFISHDLSVVEHVCDRVAVMYVGHIVELAPTEVLNTAARHPYTRALLSSVPLPDPHRRVRPLFMEGDVPDPSNPPPGCAFEPRCQWAFERCSSERPPLTALTSDHHLACWLNAGRGVEGENR